MEVPSRALESFHSLRSLYQGRGTRKSKDELTIIVPMVDLSTPMMDLTLPV